jgi:hypothetical protein
MLGRRNARSFLMRYLVLPKDNPLFQGGRWSAADVARHEVPHTPGGPADHLPIIPLFGRLARRDQEAEDDAVEPMPRWPAGAFNAKDVEELIRQRAHRVADLVYTQFVIGKLDRIARENIDKLIANQSWWLRGPLRLLRCFVEPRVLPKIEEVLRTAPAQYVTRAAVAQIAAAVTELDKAELA